MLAADDGNYEPLNGNHVISCSAVMSNGMICTFIVKMRWSGGTLCLLRLVSTLYASSQISANIGSVLQTCDRYFSDRSSAINCKKLWWIIRRSHCWITAWSFWIDIQHNDEKSSSYVDRMTWTSHLFVLTRDTFNSTDCHICSFNKTWNALSHITYVYENTESPF